MVGMRLFLTSPLVFACHSAACRPPGSGGTGGSSPKAGSKLPLYKAPSPSPHIQGLIEAAKAQKVVASDAPTGNDLVELERRVNAVGMALHGQIQRELDNEAGLMILRQGLNDAKQAIVDHREAARKLPETVPAHMREWTRETRAQAMADQEAYRASPEGRRIAEMHLKHRQEENRLNALVSETVQAIDQRRADIIVAHMSAYREMGGQITDLPNHRATAGRLSVNQSMTAAAQVYPKDWIEASNSAHLARTPRRVMERVHEDGKWIDRPTTETRQRPLVFRLVEKRAHYNDQKILTDNQQKFSRNPDGTRNRIVTTSEITLDGTRGTAIHEFFHRMEHVHPLVREVERVFLDRRSHGAAPVKLSRSLPGQGYKSDEVHTPAGLFHPYAEKVYSDGYREVGSMGWEYYVTGKKNNGLPPDADHVGTVIGAMLTL